MLIVNTNTQSGTFDYTQRVSSRAFVTLVIEHCLTAFFDVSNHHHSLISVTAFSKLVSEMSNSVRGYLNSSTLFPNTCTCRLKLYSRWSKQSVYMYKVNDVTNWLSQTTDMSFPNTCTCKLKLYSRWSKQSVYMYKVNDVTN